MNSEGFKNTFSSLGRSRLFAVLALLVAIAALFAEQLMRGISLASNAMLTMEGASQWNPFWTFARRELMRGHFPLWTPHSLGGWSFPGFPHTACFYPLAFFYYLMPYDTASTYDISLHVIITSLLMYRFLRGIEISRFSSFVGAVIWATSGLLFTFLNFIPLLWTLTWTPLFFDAARRWGAERRLSQLVLLAAVGALQVLGGSVESFAYELVALGLLAAVFGARGIKISRGAVIGVVAGLCVAALLSSAEILAAIEQASRSVRSQGISYRYFASRGFPLHLWLSLPAPMKLMGGVKSGGDFMTYNPTYMGILVLVFAIYALVTAKGRELWDRKVGLVTLILILMTTRNLPILGPILYRIPLFNLFREPGYDLFLPQFLLIVLAARGIDRMLSKVGGEWAALRGGLKNYAAVVIPALASALVLFVTAPFVRFPQKQYALAALMCLVAIGFVAVMKINRRRLKLFMAVGIIAILFVDNWAAAWSYLPKQGKGNLDVDPEYKAFFSKTQSYERHIVLDKAGPITTSLPQHAGMIINSQTLDGWEGLPNLRFIRFLDLLDDRSIVMEGKKLGKLGYHLVFREGRFVDPAGLPYMNLAGVRYLVSREVPFKFSSPSSLADAIGAFKSEPQGSLTALGQIIGGKPMKTLSIRQGARAEMPFYITAGDSIEFNACNKGGGNGSLDMTIQGAPDMPANTVFSKRIDQLADCPGERWEVDLSPWYGKTVGMSILATRQGAGAIELVEPEVVNPQKLFQRVYHGSIDIFLNPDVFPRAYLVHRIFMAGNPDEAFSWLKSNAAALRYTAPIETAKPIRLAPLYSDVLQNLAKQENVNIVRYEPDRVTIGFNMLTPGYLILTDSYYPGWRAKVDGVEAPIYPAYLAFRSVPVATIGQHTVEFIYKPTGFRIAIWMALVSSLFLVGIIVTNKLKVAALR